MEKLVKIGENRITKNDREAIDIRKEIISVEHKKFKDEIKLKHKTSGMSKMSKAIALLFTLLLVSGFIYAILPAQTRTSISNLIPKKNTTNNAQQSANVIFQESANIETISPYGGEDTFPDLNRFIPTSYPGPGGSSQGNSCQVYVNNVSNKQINNLYINETLILSFTLVTTHQVVFNTTSTIVAAYEDGTLVVSPNSCPSDSAGYSFSWNGPNISVPTSFHPRVGEQVDFTIILAATTTT